MGNKIKMIVRIATNETLSLMRETKMILLLLLLVVIKTLVNDPMNDMSARMQQPLSLTEPFVSLGNSGVIVLLVPLVFLVFMSDYPREDASQYYFFVRSDKRTWLVGQMVHAWLMAMFFVVVLLVSSGVLSLAHSRLTMEYSECVLKYSRTFPELSGDYVSELLTEKIYNHHTLGGATFITGVLQGWYLFNLALALLVAFLLGNKMIGLLMDGLLVVVGTLLCATDSMARWIFPMAHSLLGVRFTEYTSEVICPVYVSMGYFAGWTIVLSMIIILLAKRLKVN